MIPAAIPSIAARQLKLAGLWLLVGLSLGIFMSAQLDFTLRSVHAHTNLLGWATLALTGLIYAVAPAVAESPLARWHFWLHNLGLPIMMGGLAAAMLGLHFVEPFIKLGALTTVAGLLLFVINLFRRL